MMRGHCKHALHAQDLNARSWLARVAVNPLHKSLGTPAGVDAPGVMHAPRSLRGPRTAYLRTGSDPGQVTQAARVDHIEYAARATDQAAFP